MRPIRQYEHNGVFIRIWESAAQAAEALGIHRESINQCLRGKIKITSTYYFEYIEDDEIKNKEKEIILVYQYSLDGTFIRSWETISKAGEELKISKSSISACLYGRYKSAGKFLWAYSNKPKPEPYRQKKYTRSVSKYNLDGEFIKKYESIAEAASDNCVTASAIDSCLRGRANSSAGFIWKYADVNSEYPPPKC